jgi:hypothetical protein
MSQDNWFQYTSPGLLSLFGSDVFGERAAASLTTQMWSGLSWWQLIVLGAVRPCGGPCHREWSRALIHGMASLFGRRNPWDRIAGHEYCLTEHPERVFLDNDEVNLREGHVGHTILPIARSICKSHGKEHYLINCKLDAYEWNKNYSNSYSTYFFIFLGSLWYPIVITILGVIYGGITFIVIGCLQWFGQFILLLYCTISKPNGIQLPENKDTTKMTDEKKEYHQKMIEEYNKDSSLFIADQLKGKLALCIEGKHGELEALITHASRSKKSELAELIRCIGFALLVFSYIVGSILCGGGFKGWQWWEALQLFWCITGLIWGFDASGGTRWRASIHIKGISWEDPEPNIKDKDGKVVKIKGGRWREIVKLDKRAQLL